MLGIVFPSFATFLLAFVPLPDWVDRTWVRLAMLAAAAIVPARRRRHLDPDAGA